jgi:hypothetical protein
MGGAASGVLPYRRVAERHIALRPGAQVATLDP